MKTKAIFWAKFQVIE